jgi:hypothetical protein
VKFLFKVGMAEEASMGMKVKFFSMTPRKSNIAHRENLQAHPAPG